MCYQGALEEMIKRFNRLPEGIREKLGKGGGIRSDDAERTNTTRNKGC